MVAIVCVLTAVGLAMLLGPSGGAAAKVPQADLSLTMSDSPDPVLTRDGLRYAIEVGNSGPDNGRRVTMTDHLPKGSTFRSSQTSQGSCRFRKSSRSVICRLGSVAGGAGTTAAAVRIAIHISAPPDPGTVSSTARVASVNRASHDPDSANNAHTETTSVIPRPARHFTLSVSTSGHGHGHVTGPGIDCPGDCSQTYRAGTTVTLATPHGTHSRFAGWGGDCSDRGRCTLTMSRDHSVSATFKFKPPDTEITKADVKPHQHTARFAFEAKGRATGFQCKLMSRHHNGSFRQCTSPKGYRHLRPGVYTFKVRAKGPGGTDPTAAKRTFRIRR